MSTELRPDVEDKKTEQYAAEVGVMITKMLDAMFDSIFDGDKVGVANAVVLEILEKKLDKFLQIDDKDMGRYLYIIASHYQFGKKFKGFSYEVDYAKALKLFTISADLGYGMAQYCLANSYEHCVMDLPLDFDKAIYWYQKAAESGIEESLECIQRVKNKKAGLN